MKLSEFNESVKYSLNYKDGVVVYLDKEALKIRINSAGEEKHGLTKTIRTENDLNKILSVYKNTDKYIISLILAFINRDAKAYFDASNSAKKVDKNAEFRKALGAMQVELLNNIED